MDDNLPVNHVIACAVLEDEVAAALAACHSTAVLHLVEQGLHNEPERLRAQLQDRIDAVEAASGPAGIIALAYGLCSRGCAGLGARRSALLIPRAHDCLTILLGSRERYDRYQQDHPGTYWYSPGWNRHGAPPSAALMASKRATYAASYGEDQADYLMDCLEHWVHDYRRAAYVHQGTHDISADEAFTRSAAAHFGWEYACEQGDPALLRDLVAGRHDPQRFCLIPPGWVSAHDDAQILIAVSGTGGVQ